MQIYRFRYLYLCMVCFKLFISSSFTRLMKYLQPENKCMEKSLSKMSKPCEAKRSQIMDLIHDYTGRYCTDTDPKPEVIQSECS